jgi:hypothetical protein
MAIDTRLPLAVSGPRDIGQVFNNALLNAQGFQELRQQREQAPLQNRLLQAQVGTAEAGQTRQEQINRFQSVAFGAAEILPGLQSGNFAGVNRQLQARRAKLVAEGKNTAQTDEAIGLLATNPQQLLTQVNEVIGVAQQQGILKAPSAAQRTKFIGTPQRISRQVPDPVTGELVSKNFLSGIVQQRDGTFKREDVAVEGSFLSTIGETAEEESTRAVKEAGDVAGAKITGASKAKAKSAPLIAKTESFIRSKVKLAEKAAAETGEVLTDLARMKAALPGLTDVVNKLRELAPIATSTFGGKVFDTAVRELGFGSTKGATASAKFGAMVNNQVLPLLKPTFGAAFTVQEGESLRQTMGDKSAPAEQKMATLDAFLEQKQRDIETKELQLQQTSTQDTTATQPQVIRFDAQGNIIQ